TGGSIRINGEEVTHLSPGEMRPYRKRIQMVFQDPYASLNPRMKAGQIVGEPLENYSEASGSAQEQTIAALFEKVGLRPEAMRRYPFEFSGGQRQRLGRAAASLHASPDRRGAGRRPAPEARASRARGRRALAHAPAPGLPLPHPLPLRLRPLPRRGAGAEAVAAGRPPRRLPSAGLR